MNQRIKPIELCAQFHFGRSNITDGVLNIYPREGSSRHPIGGHFYAGDNAIPFMGTIDGLNIIRAPDAQFGRPSKTARDTGVYMAYQSILGCMFHTLPLPQAQAFAKNECLKMWSEWPGIQDARALRRARKNVEEDLSKLAALTFTGTAPDMSNYVTLLALPGATWQVHAGKVQICGPAWVWRWGEEKATRSNNCRAEAIITGASDTTLMLT